MKEDEDKYSKGFLAWFIGNQGLYAARIDGTFVKVSEDDLWLEGFFQHLNHTMSNT